MKLTIRNLPIKATLGIFPEEKQAPREFMLNAELEVDAAQAAQTDEFLHAVNYVELEKALLKLAISKPWNLVEALAHHCAKMLVECDAKVQQATVTIDKPQALQFAESVALTASYSKQEK